MTRTNYTIDSPLKIGTRGSPLALAQAYETRDRLVNAFGFDQQAIEIVVIHTTGDNRTMIDADRPLKEIGNKGLFTKEIEDALLMNTIDIAVHSMKDMPTQQPDGLVLECYLPREDARDAFVSYRYDSIESLPKGARVGTSSLRRKAQLLQRRPDLDVVEFRGNVQTRLKKLKDGTAEATFLAMAGLNRLMMEDVPATPIVASDMLNAVAQGAIGIERRADDQAAKVLLDALHDEETGYQLAAERGFLAALDGSCETPIAALAILDDDSITLMGEVLRLDGSQTLHAEISGPITQAEALGQALADNIRMKAGQDLVAWMTEKAAD